MNGPARNHYFSPHSTAPSEPRDIEVQVRGLILRLHTDRGVFSKRHADPGTLLLARTVEFPPEGAILDLGCGYGLIGVLAARLCPAARVTLVDVNSRAAELAARNCARYGLTNAEVMAGDARQVLGESTFDAIALNPPYRQGKAEIMSLIADAAQRLRPGGSLWIVGRTRQGIKTLARDIAPLFAGLETVAIKGGYRVLRCHRQ